VVRKTVSAISSAMEKMAFLKQLEGDRIHGLLCFPAPMTKDKLTRRLFARTSGAFRISELTYL